MLTRGWWTATGKGLKALATTALRNSPTASMKSMRVPASAHTTKAGALPMGPLGARYARREQRPGNFGGIRPYAHDQ